MYDHGEEVVNAILRQNVRTRALVVVDEAVESPIVRVTEYSAYSAVWRRNGEVKIALNGRGHLKKLYTRLLWLGLVDIGSIQIKCSFAQNHNSCSSFITTV